MISDRSTVQALRLACSQQESSARAFPSRDLRRFRKTGPLLVLAALALTGLSLARGAFIADVSDSFSARHTVSCVQAGDEADPPAVVKRAPGARTADRLHRGGGSLTGASGRKQEDLLSGKILCEHFHVCVFHGHWRIEYAARADGVLEQVDVGTYCPDNTFSLFREPGDADSMRHASWLPPGTTSLYRALSLQALSQIFASPVPEPNACMLFLAVGAMLVARGGIRLLVPRFKTGGVRRQARKAC